MQQGFKDRISFLYVDQSDIISGYDDLIINAVNDLFEALAPDRPRVLLIFVSCIDDLIGTDHEALIERLTILHPDIRFRDCHMNPISSDSPTPPGISIQNKLYSLLEPRIASDVPRDDAVNSVGNLDVIAHDSELHDFLRYHGIKELRHISMYDAFDDYQTMAKSRLNLVTSPMGMQAALQMERLLGIPHLFLPVSYRMENVAGNYRVLESAVCSGNGRSFDFSTYEKEAEAAISNALETVGNLPVIVDDSSVLKSFELARALIEYGFNVARVVTGECPDCDLENLHWVLENAPHVEIIQPEHHHSVHFDRRLKRSVAVGVDGAYLADSEYLVDLLGDAGMYGYRGISTLMGRIAAAVSHKADIRAVIDSYGLVI
jgi:hypothetical protein